MAEKKEEPQGRELKIEIARMAIRVASKAKRGKDEEFPKWNTIMGILNHAQGMVGIDDTKANRLLSQAKTITK